MKRGTKRGNTNVVESAGLVLDGRSRRPSLRQILPFMGPAFIASIAYIDPGNFATNIQGGAGFGYTLLWVVVASNLLFGTIAEQVAASSAVPVLLIRTGKAGAAPILSERPILVLLDGTSIDGQSLPLAGRAREGVRWRFVSGRGVRLFFKMRCVQGREQHAVAVAPGSRECRSEMIP